MKTRSRAADKGLAAKGVVLVPLLPMARSRIQGRHAFAFGRVLGRTFPIWARNIVPFTILSLIVYSPVLVYAYVAFPDDPGDEKALAWYLWTIIVGSYVLGLLTTGAFVYGVFQQLRGEPAGVGDCLRVGLTRLLPVVGVAALAALLTALGLVALIIGAIVVACMLWVAVPVAVVERPGVVASLKRSAQLTSGHKGTIFGIVFVIGIMDRAVDMILDKAMGPDAGMAAVWVTVATTLMFSSLQAVASAVGYHDLRVAKEGIGIEDLARVFA